MALIEVKNLNYAYDDNVVLNNVSLSINQGEYVCILGKNGSGKSTLAKILSLNPDGVGIVYQNPDNQFVSSIIKEDLAFYPSNLGIDEEEIETRIIEALKAVDMQGYENKSTHLLSGGQKQRIAIAGVLTGGPEVLIFDEVTSMLDPKGKEDVLNIIDRLHKEGKTIITITHDSNEAIRADRIIVLNNGNIVCDDSAYNVLTNIELLNENSIEVPLCIRLYFDLKDRGFKLDKCPINEEELLEELCRLN